MKKVSAKAATEKYGSLAKHRAFLGKPPKKGSVVPFPCDAAVVFAKQVAGLVRRLEAVPGRDIAIGLSGGLDSALALLVAVAAYAKLGLDKRGLHVYTMPGFGTTRRTKGNAELLCEGLGVKLETISIVKACRQHFKDIGHDGKTPDVTYENAQARMRTLILMDKANMTGGFVLGTGDLSEIALGWCTYNGDHMAMFAVNNDVPKTVVRKICRWWAGENPGKAADAILDIVATPVSPELVKGQVTENAIGPYELHDFFLWNFIMNEMGSRDLQSAAERYFAGRYAKHEIAATLSTFMRRFFTQAFKRNCQCDGVKVFPFELSPHGWWIPSELGIVKL
ncbi:MAG: NAD(+) synthase [Kiritimatiellae bacterium]|nr:NAD(+) synthase [Kiritimatiellia bacterium]